MIRRSVVFGLGFLSGVGSVLLFQFIRTLTLVWPMLKEMKFEQTGQAVQMIWRASF
jgi:hypothetical protein